MLGLVSFINTSTKDKFWMTVVSMVIVVLTPVAASVINVAVETRI